MQLKSKDESIRRAEKLVMKPGYKFPVQKRVEVVTKFLALNNLKLTAALTGVSYALIRVWKQEPWWDLMIAEIKSTKRANLDDKLSRIINKALDAVEDRIDHGDPFWDQKNNKLEYKPISIKEARGAANDLLQRQQVLEKMSIAEDVSAVQHTIADQLELLKLEFAKFNNNRTVEVVANAIHEERKEGYKAGERPVQLTAGASEGSDGEESGESGSESEWDECSGEGCGSQEASEQGWDELAEEFEGSDEDSE